MLRNDLITQLAQKDNDNVAVDVGGILVDVRGVSTDRGSIVLLLEPEEFAATLRQVASDGPPVQGKGPGTTRDPRLANDPGHY